MCRHWPGRADAVHRHRARRAGLRCRGSRSVLLTLPALRMFSVPLPELPTYEFAGMGPGRAGAVHRRRARRAGVGADVAGRVADAAAVEDVQRAVTGIANAKVPALVQVEPAPSTVAVPVEPGWLPR